MRLGLLSQEGLRQRQFFRRWIARQHRSEDHRDLRTAVAIKFAGRRPDQLDAVVHRGGPLKYADEVGLFNVAQAMKRFAQNPLDDATFWQPAPLLARPRARQTPTPPTQATRQRRQASGPLLLLAPAGAAACEAARTGGAVPLPDADVLTRYALFCARTGRFNEATSAMDRAIVLDRLNPRTYRQ